MAQVKEVNNSFKILSSILNENALTEYLRYLLDSGESHNLGDKFSFAFFNLLPKNYRLNNKSIVSATSQWRTDNGRKIDIVVVAKDAASKPPSLALGIEAKTFSKEGDNQIADYQIGLSEAFPGTRKLMVYLTPTGVPPKTHNKGYKPCKVCALSWEKIAALCQQINDPDKLLIDFADHIRENVLNLSSANDSNPFFEDLVLPEIQKRLGKADLKIAWKIPEKNSHEFNFSHKEINSLFADVTCPQ